MNDEFDLDIHLTNEVGEDPMTIEIGPTTTVQSLNTECNTCLTDCSNTCQNTCGGTGHPCAC